jgi:AsmA protein
MRSKSRYILIAIAAMLALLIAAAAILAASFDPNDYKPQLIRLVQEKKQRTLTIPGEIRLSFFPKIGAELGPLSLSEHKGSAEFASVERARVSLALIPLLSKQLVVDQVQIEGLRANIRRNKDGSTNFDDLLAADGQQDAGKGEAGGRQFRFDIDGVRLKRANLVFDDRQQGRKLTIADLDLETGKIAVGTPGELQLDAQVKGNSPDIDARVALKTGFTLDLDKKHYVLKGLDASLKGGLAGLSDLDLKLAGDASLDKLLFTSPQLTLSLTGKQGDTSLDGTLATPLTVNLDAKVVELHKVAAGFKLPNPAGGTLALNAIGNVAVNYGRQTASAILNGSLDQSAFRAKLGLSDFSPPVYTFDIGIDQIDLDRYRSKPAGNQPAAPPGKAVAEKPLDFSMLQKLHASGTLRAGALKVANIRTADVRLDVRAAGGKLDINPIAARMYGGSAAGALSITAGKAMSQPRFALRHSLTGIHVGPLLQDATGKAQVEGRGNVQLDVTAGGTLVDAIRKSLDGSARLELRDGAIRGINVAQAVRNAKARIGEIRGQEPAQSGTGSADEKTDFSELTASFRIVNGVAHNEDLNIKSPLLRVGGAGDIDLGAGRLDYVAKATVVTTLKGQGGPELESLKGLTVPVRLSGPFSAIGWRIDFAGMASELAKQRLDEKKEDVKAKAQQSLEEQKAKVQERLKERLKGVFN